MIEWFFIGMIIGFIILVLIRDYNNKNIINAAADAAISDLEMQKEWIKVMIDLHMLRYDRKDKYSSLA